MEHLNKDIGTKIKQYRKAISMSSTELAQLSGSSQSTISQIENGRPTNIETIIKISKALNITLFEILPDYVLPEQIEENPEKRQVIALLNQLSEGEIKTIQTLLSTNIYPVLKSILPLVKALDNLNEEERTLINKIISSLANNLHIKG